MADRLRDLIDLVLDSLDEPAADGRALADRAHFSRDHLDRLLAAATGESPVGLRRRLLLERAAWQLRTGAATASETAAAAGYGSLAAFSRAFARAYGEPPSAFAASSRPVPLEAPNGIHFHPPAGLLLPANPGSGTFLARDASKVPDPFLARVRELLAAADPLSEEALARPLRPGLVVVWFEGEEASAAVMAERLVFTLEVWVAAMAGEPFPQAGGGLPARFERAARAAVVHLWRRARARRPLRRDPHARARRRARRAGRRRRLGRPDRVGGGAFEAQERAPAAEHPHNGCPPRQQRMRPYPHPCA
jgi:AraC family transcriptional regulator